MRGINVLERAQPGAPWTDRGRTLDGHHCSSIMIEPRRGGVFAGMHSGGLYYSADGGETWELRVERHHDRARVLARLRAPRR